MDTTIHLAAADGTALEVLSATLGAPTFRHVIREALQSGHGDQWSKVAHLAGALERVAELVDIPGRDGVSWFKCAAYVAAIWDDYDDALLPTRSLLPEPIRAVTRWLRSA